MTVVEGYPKAPFSIATTSRGVGEGTPLFPGFLDLTLETYFIMLSFKQGGILIIQSETIHIYIYIYIYIYIEREREREKERERERERDR